MLIFRAQIRHYSRRVVVTGVGALTPLGRDVPSSWKALLEGRSGITSTHDDRSEYRDLPCRVGAFINKPNSSPIFEATQIVSTSEVRTLSTGTIYALHAVEEALQDARWKPSPGVEADRTGVAIGMAMTDLDYVVETGMAFKSGGQRKISPFFVPRILTNMASGVVALRYKFRGPNHSVATACATGIHAIGDGFQFIKYGKADVMACGGTECAISPLSIAGFCRMRALSTKYNDTPESASRPFDKYRDGFVMSEGAAVLILEELEHAKSRGARIYGEILGYGLAADAHHITAASENGDGAFLCMNSALNDAQIPPETVGHINAHATSTPLGDIAEVSAIKRLFPKQTPIVSATKSSTGHLLGAAGALETIFTLLSVRDAVVPPTLNTESLDVKCEGIALVKAKTSWDSKKNRRIALKNSFGFGGTNATLVIGEYS